MPRPRCRSEQEARRRWAHVSRQIARLRSHGLIARLPRQRLYRVTAYGRRYMTAAIALHDHDFPVAYAAAP